MHVVAGGGAGVRTRWLLAVVVVLWLAMRTLCYGGLCASDPLEYLAYSHRLATGTFELEPHHFATRFAVTAPIAVCFKLFGVSVASATAWPIACSLVTLLLIFALARRYGGDGAGLLAAAAFALLPLDVSESTNVLPDPILATFAVLSVWCFVRGDEASARGERAGARGEWRARAWWLAAGACLWCAWSAKTLGALLAVVFAVHALADGRRALRLGWVALGALLLLLPESTWYWAERGDPLYSLNVIDDVHEQSAGVRAANANLAYRLLKEYPRKVLLPNEHFGLLGPFLLGGMLVMGARLRSLRLLYAWVAVLGLYLNFGSSNLSRFVAIPANTRYLQPIVVPVVILFALAAQQAWRTSGRLRWPQVARGGLAALGVTLALTCIATSWVHAGRSFMHLTLREGLQAARVLQAEGQRLVHTDTRTARVLDFATAYAPSFSTRPFPPAEPLELAATYVQRFDPSSVLLLNWREIHRANDLRTVLPDQARVLRELVGAGEADVVHCFGAPPCDAWFHLASVPWILPGVSRDERIEYFGAESRERGTWVAVPSASRGVDAERD